MAVETTPNRASFSGDGTTTVFSFPYYFLTEAGLKVILRVNSTGVETTKTLTTHYTVAGEGDEAGGSVTMVTAPAVGETLTIFRDEPLTQDLDLDNLGTFDPVEIVERLDKLTMHIQRLDDRVDRSVRLSDGFYQTFDTELPKLMAASANKVPLCNSSGNGFAAVADWPTADEIQDADDSATAAAASAAAALLSETAAAASAASIIPPGVTGTRAAPSAIVAGTGIAFTGTKWVNTWFIQGSGGAVDVSANPQIAAATNPGQRLQLIGRSDTNTVLLEDGTGLELNGSWLGKASSVLDLIWDGTNWLEVGRNSI